MGWRDGNEDFEFSKLVGLTLTEIIGDKGSDELIFKTADQSFKMYHEQDCCEGVSIEDICGDMNDLIGSPILQAEESTSDENPLDPSDAEYGSFTWTFYKLATIKGSVTIRWYGSSNGYYSESVSFELINDTTKL